MTNKQIAQIVFAYALFAATYILLSDLLLFGQALPDHPEVIVSIAKGLVYVVLSSVLLGLMVRRERDTSALRFTAMFRNHHAVMLVLDPKTNAIVEANPAAEAFYGRTRADLLTLHIQDLNTLSKEEIQAEIAAALETGRTSFHFRHRAAGGQIRDVEVLSGPVTHQGQTLLFSIVLDRTEQARLAGVLQESEARFRHAIHEAPYPIVLHAEDGQVLSANRSWVDITGYNIRDLPTVGDWLHHAYTGSVDEVTPLVQESYGLTAHKHYGDFIIRCRDHSERVWSFHSVGLGLDTAGRRLAMTIANDVTERRRAEADLLASHARVERVLDHIPDLVFTNRNDQVSYINPAGATLLGYAAPSDCVGLSIYEFFVPGVHDQIRHRIDMLRQTPGSRAPNLIEEMVAADGTTRVMEVSAVSYLHEGAVEIEVVGRDVRDRIQVEKTRLEAQAQFSAIAEQAVAGIFALSQQAELTYANPKVAAILGRPQVDLVGLTIATLVVPEELPVVLRGLQRCFAGDWTTLHHEFHCLRQDGSTVLVDAHATLATVGGQRVLLGVLNDITDRRQVEATIQEYIARLEGAVLGTASAVAQMVELRDPYTAGHERRVGELAAAIAAEMGLDAHVQRGLKVAGAVHDVGKIKVPAEILSKPGRLSVIEYALIQQHAGHSHDVLKNVEFPWPIAEMVWQHHERLDGSGYPRGLKGDEILLEASILAVADIVESMSSHRPYRAALGVPAALAEIEATAGTKLHPEVVAACLRLFREQGYQIPL